MAKAGLPQSAYREDDHDDVSHTLLACSHFVEDRRSFGSTVSGVAPC